MSSDPVQPVAQEPPAPVAVPTAAAAEGTPAQATDSQTENESAAPAPAPAGETLDAAKPAAAPASPASPSPAKKIESARRSLQADVVNSISCIEDFGSSICAVSSGAKEVLGDIGFYLLKKILDKAVEISDNLMARTTLSPQAIKAAACTIVPPIITSEAMEDWKAAFEGAANPAAWIELYKTYEAKVEDMRVKNPEWAKDTKARGDFSKRKNDFARKSLNLMIRPTLTIRLARLIVPKHIRTGGINVGIALSYVLSAIFDMLGWAVIESNPKKAGNWRLSTRAIYNGISVSEPLRFLLGDLVVAGGPLGLLVNPSGPAGAKKKQKKVGRKQAVPDVDDSLDDLSDESDMEEGEIDDDQEESESESESEEEESESEEEEEEEEKPLPKKRKAPANKKSKKNAPAKAAKTAKPSAKQPTKFRGAPKRPAPASVRKGKGPAAKKAKK